MGTRQSCAVPTSGATVYRIRLCANCRRVGSDARVDRRKRDFMLSGLYTYGTIQRDDSDVDVAMRRPRTRTM